jgi:hypothetical protein
MRPLRCPQLKLQPPLRQQVALTQQMCSLLHLHQQLTGQDSCKGSHVRTAGSRRYVQVAGGRYTSVCPSVFKKQQGFGRALAGGCYRCWTPDPLLLLARSTAQHSTQRPDMQAAAAGAGGAGGSSSR